MNGDIGICSRFDNQKMKRREGERLECVGRR